MKSPTRRQFGRVGVLTVCILCGVSCMMESAVLGWTIGRPIVTYYGGPGYDLAQTDATAQQIAAGGWNLAWAQTTEELDILHAHGLRALWKGSLDDATIISIRNHPALYDYFVEDEPSVSRFDFLAGTVSRLHNLDHNHMAYINLNPCSGSWGGGTYQNYLNQYINQVHPELLSYDHYQFMAGKDTSQYFKNLAIISHTAKQAGIPFMNIVQSSKWDSTWRNPNGNELRYLYNTSLAYGAEGISDFVYYLPSSSGHTGGMANDDGATTALYTTAQTLNPQFEAIVKQVQPLTHMGAYHLGDLPPGYGTTDGSSPLRLPGNSPFTVSGIANSTYVTGDPVRGAVVGLWGSKDAIADATYAYVTNLNYSGTLTTRITGPDDLSIFNPTTGKWIAQGHAWADVTIEQGGGVLVGLTSIVPEPASWIGLLGALIVGLGFLRFRSHSV